MIGRVVIAAIRAYQAVSRFTPATCRFYPTCSEYAVQAIQKYGACKGLALALWRICRCHPWTKGGFDPVR